MERRELERLWADQRNWKRWKGIVSIYYCPGDPRVVVPKPIRWMGWTINFAHPRAAFSLLFLSLFIAVGPALGVLAAGKATPPRVGLALAFSVVALIVLAAYLSSRTE